MKKKYLLLSFVIICILGVINTTKVNSKIIFPPYGSSGDPTTQLTCVQSGCHGGTNQTVSSQNLSLKIGTDSNSLSTFDNTFTYSPGQTYYIKLKVLATGYAYGFQMTALTASQNMAGSFTVVSSATTKLQLGPPDYIGHLHANHSTNSWIYQWTAPAGDSGAVTFYYAFNAGDSTNFSNLLPDNNIYVGTTTIQKGFGVGVNEISSMVSDLEVYPNPVNGAFSLSFNLVKSGNVSASVYSVDGKLCRQLVNENMNSGAFNRNYNMASLPAGIYLVKLNMDGATITKKIVKV